VAARRTTSGFTLIEVLISVTIVVLLSVMIVQSIRGLTTTQAHSEGQLKVVSLAERVVQDLARDVRFSIRVYTEGDDAQECLAHLALTHDRMPADSRLPVAQNRGYFEPDPDDADLTGNQLLCVTRLPHVDVDVSEARDGSDLQRVDLYRFVVWHLARRADQRLDLVRWGSRAVASHPDLAAMADSGRRAAASLQLGESGVFHAWNPGASAGSEFFRIQPGSGELIPMDRTSERVGADPEQVQFELLSRRAAEIASNGGVTSFAVPAYAHARDDFPHGFEIKVDASGVGQLVLVRMVVALRQGGHVSNSTEMIRLISLREG
jgi:prepilin-type N-terminal cleavage/methylation domain-containing protein